MDIKELLKFIETESKRLRKYYSNVDEDKIILAQTVKITEELGELCSEVLARNALQRKEKLENYNGENIQEEFADVIITTLLLAKSMNIDIEKALEQKMGKINKRYEEAV